MNHAFAAEQRTGRAFPWVLAGLVGSALVGAFWVTADVPPLRPDTASYLYFDPSRPIGYPAFLWVVDLFGEPLWAARIQMVVLAASLFLLGWAFYRWSGNPALSLLFQAALVASPEMWKFSATLITEGLATAGVALWCAQLLVTVRRPSLGGIAILSLISAASMLVKPALVIMFIATAAAVSIIEGRQERYSSAAIIGAALISVLGVTPIANHFLHGSASSGSPVARGIFQHTLFCPMPGLSADWDSAFVEQQARPVREYIASAPRKTQEQLKRIYTGKLRFGLIIPALGRRHGIEASWQTDSLIRKIAMERVAANPTCYIDSAMRSYFALITYKSNSRADADRLAKFLESKPRPEIPVVRPLPRDERLAVLAARDLMVSRPRLAGRQDFEPPTGRPLVLIWLARVLYGSAAVIGFLAVILWVVRRNGRPRRRKLVTCAAALGILFHGVFGLTALVELHLTRYAVPLWPVVSTLLGISGFEILRQRWPALYQAKT